MMKDKKAEKLFRQKTTKYNPWPWVALGLGERRALKTFLGKSMAFQYRL